MSRTDLLPDPIARLTDEHRQIDRVLVAVSEVAIRVHAGAPPDHRFFAATVEFIERFADGSHHSKEEGALFEEIWAVGYSRSGSLACMISQHEMGRELTQVLKQWVNGSGQYREAHLNEMVGAAVHYTNLMWNHMATEDRAIFPALESCLSTESLARVLARYGQLDSTRPDEFRLAADRVVGLGAPPSLERATVSASQR
jgi:hemerythrin-like domain-containing protein